MRIAMWSGPRNISTALMRAWENRPDTFVWDEPFYAYYLLKTGRQHPGADEIIDHDENDWQKVVDRLLGDIPQGNAIFYLKQMTHHLLPEIDRGWIGKMTNCFLIRDPREMLTSYLKIEHLSEPKLEDIGLPQQWEIFELVRNITGEVPPVLDSKDVLDHPRSMLEGLCARIGVDFYEEMFSWPAGSRETDGIWAKYWYAGVEQTTGFQPYKPKPDRVPDHLQKLLQRCLEIYNRLFEYRMLPFD